MKRTLGTLLYCYTYICSVGEHYTNEQNRKAYKGMSLHIDRVERRVFHVHSQVFFAHDNVWDALHCTISTIYEPRSIHLFDDGKQYEYFIALI